MKAGFSKEDQELVLAPVADTFMTDEINARQAGLHIHLAGKSMVRFRIIGSNSALPPLLFDLHCVSVGILK